MAKILKSAAAQYPLVVHFPINYNDTMVNIDGTELAFGADDAVTTTFDIFNPPPGSMVIGGRVIVETVVGGSSTATMDVGDADDPNRYTEAAAINLKDADAPASGFDLAGDGKVYDGSEKIRITILNDGAQTSGKYHVVVSMVVNGRQNENLKTT